MCLLGTCGKFSESVETVYWGHGKMFFRGNRENVIQCESVQIVFTGDMEKM